jgi:hypothetical protein
MVPDPSATPDRVFISFASHDQAKALELCERLEREGLDCWISLRDVQPGQNYQAAVVQAITSAKVVVLVFSGAANRSEEISKELSLASASKIPVIPFRIENVLPEGAFRYELATRQWIDAFRNWNAAADALLDAIRSAPEGTAKKPISSPPPRMRPSDQAVEAARSALTHYIGPIAPVLIRKAASEATSLDDFHDRLASHVPAEERTAFRSRLQVKT